MEENHPIEGLMAAAMNSIKQMIDVNTIIGEPIKALDNTVIIPISKVGFGFAAGGSEFNDETVNTYNRKEKEENIKYRLPFGGGSGAGASITPVAFLIVQNDSVKLLEATHSSVLEKLAEYVPDVIEKINKLFSKDVNDADEEDDDEFYNEEDEDDTDWYEDNDEDEEDEFEEQSNKEERKEKTKLGKSDTENRKSIPKEIKKDSKHSIEFDDNEDD